MSITVKVVVERALLEGQRVPLQLLLLLAQAVALMLLQAPLLVEVQGQAEAVLLALPWVMSLPLRGLLPLPLGLVPARRFQSCKGCGCQILRQRRCRWRRQWQHQRCCHCRCCSWRRCCWGC